MSDQIIIIEDDDATRYAYERAFRNAGYSVDGSRHYFNAAPVLNRGEGGLLVLDISLYPGTPHGIAVARMARSKRANLSVIFVTGHPEYATHVDETDVVYIKPVDPEALVAAARVRLNK